MIKIILEKNQDVFFTSDTHWHHKNICRGVSNWPVTHKTRNYPDLETMNEHIIRNINNTVGQEDWLVHLGDWSFGGFDNIKNFRNRIICKNIILVIGNHDHHVENNRDNCQSLFYKTTHYTKLEIQHNKPGKIDNFVLMHYPITSWNEMGKGMKHLFGHVHLSPNNRVMPGRSMDVGMDGHPDFRPYSIEEINILLRNQPIKGNVLPNDHHEN